MNNQEYKKIKLISTVELANNKDKVDERKEKVEQLMKENNIDYAIEILESEPILSSKRVIKTIYTLNLIIKKEDLEKVKEILDISFGFPYEVLEENNIKKEKLDNKIKTNKSKSKKKLDFKAKLALAFIIFIFCMIFAFEIVLIMESGIQTPIFIIMIIEFFVLIKIVKIILNRKDE